MAGAGLVPRPCTSLGPWGPGQPGAIPVCPGPWGVTVVYLHPEGAVTASPDPEDVIAMCPGARGAVAACPGPEGARQCDLPLRESQPHGLSQGWHGSLPVVVLRVLRQRVLVLRGVLWCVQVLRVLGHRVLLQRVSWQCVVWRCVLDLAVP